MKNLIGITVLIVTLVTGLSLQKGSKTKTITFITSAVCDECKERIEDKLNYTKGVIYAELNLDDKMLTVKYKTEVITEQEIKEVLANLGYSSDTVKRNEEAYQALPKCCRGADICEPKK